MRQDLHFIGSKVASSTVTTMMAVGPTGSSGRAPHAAGGLGVM